MRSLKVDIDIESAIAEYFAPGDSTDEGKNNNIQFYVDGKDSWVEFRGANQGDSAILASLFSNVVEYPANDDHKEAEGSYEFKVEKVETLEMKIANSLGDEHSPPAMQAIVAVICKSIDEGVVREEGRNDYDSVISKEICGGAIVTIDWNAHESMRYLRVEEIAVDESKIQLKDLLVRRLILALSTIALQSACGGLLISSSARKIFDNREEGTGSEESEFHSDSSRKIQIEIHGSNEKKQLIFGKQI